MESFDSRAKSWDDNPMHLDRSMAIAEKMRSNIRLHKKMSALEYGAGTGILSFLLKDELHDITMMDNSREMVNVMNDKIKSTGSGNLHAIFCNLETATDADKTYDLIFLQMVLHHVEKVNDLLTLFNGLLNNSGTLAIADLYTEDGSFHGKEFTGHKGFDVEALSDMLSKIGFKNIRHQQCYSLKKIIDAGESKEFPIFLLLAEK